jgi:DnaJ like chaperone protein
LKSPHFSEFELLLLRSGNELGTSLLLILAWIAASDGMVDKSESDKLYEIAKASNYAVDIGHIIKIARNRDIEAIKLASEIVKASFQGQSAKLFLTMAIGMAVSDGLLRPSENYILRFLGDLCQLAKSDFESLFLKVTGKTLPHPSDPSKASYWQARERPNQNSGSEYKSQSDQRAQQESLRNRETINAYAVLGLEFGASKEEIRLAYRRLAQIHHPDRFSPLGAESVAAATSTFQRIKIAYDYLVAHA